MNLMIRCLVLICLASSTLGIHHKLTKRELQHVFGVEEVHQVPEYELIKTEKYHKEDGGLRIRFTAWGDEYVLDLKPNTGLISPHIVSIVRNGSEVRERKGLELDHNCHFQGTVSSHGRVPVAISDCRSLMGTLVMDDHFLVLQTVPHRIRHHNTKEHLVFKRSPSLLTPFERNIEEEIIRLNDIQEPFCDTSESIDDPITAEILSLNYTIPSSAKLDSPFVFPNLDPITLEIGLFLDSKLYEHFQREYIQDAEQHLLDFSLALINNVHVLYQQPTLSPNLEIVIVRYEMWKSQPSNLATFVHKNGQAQSLLDAFCRHQAHINPGTDLTDMGHWDHGVLLTGYDIYHTTASVAGVAPVARMCDQLFACSLVEGLHLGRSFVLAHEMGHNMGMVHDGVQNQCSKSCCLMSAVNGAGKTTWSECSVREFNAFLLQLDESGTGNCLRDGSPGLLERNHLQDGRTPGQRFTADQQCAYFWGRDYKVEIPNGRSMEDICRILWCGNGGSTISTAHPALEGSYCGNGKWCHEGRCLPWMSGPAPEVVHGGWSNWSSDDRCPVQHCQISNSIPVRPQHRDCVNPAPNNGGVHCEGAAIRGILCSTRHSTCQGFSREDYSNRICSAIKHDPVKPDRQLTGEGFEHSTQPCKVWCHLIDSELIRNKGQFPDGTPCGPDQYCISGTCLRLGCSGKAVVASDDDCPDRKPTSGWGDWSSWSECSASCGTHGRQTRHRECVGRQGFRGCHGEMTEQRPCSPKPPQCEKMSKWSEWAVCDSDCGQGQQRRKRQCLARDCDEDLEQRRPCWSPGKMACWLEWSDWSHCSQTCDGGHRRRERACPLEGECEGVAFEVEQCNTERCSSGTWGDWLPCSVSCGIGFQIRERLCDGTLCATANKQARTCNEQPCPESSNDFVWEEWSEWTPCSQTCGEGVQSKERTCRKGQCPSSDNYRQRRCVSGPCPVWVEWSEWSECTSCSSDLTRTRKRHCMSHSNEESASCEGPSDDEETCDRYCKTNGIADDSSHGHDIELITGKGRRRVVAHGGRIVPVSGEEAWGEWMEWTVCSQSCGTGIRRRARVCIGQSCPPQPLEAVKENCNEQPCPSELYWSPWSAWSTCSATCGDGGVQSRRRHCLRSFLFQCDGEPLETQSCSSGVSCAPPQESRPVVIPTWSEWSSWSSCSCFSLMESRRRYCLVSDPAVQGFCVGAILDQRPCSPRSCGASPGGWSDWSEWSQCSKDCQGTGHQIRNRMCSEPLPSNRGSYCVGYSFDQRPCTSSAPCGDRVDGGWSDWSEWSECGDSCVNAHRSRTRYCTSPRPSQGGKPCFGSDFELQPCVNEAKCRNSVDGGWESWSAWSDCPEGCGFALQFRNRACSNPPPSSGGQACHGLAHHTSVCDTELCNESMDGGWSAWNEWSACIGNCGLGSRTRVRACVSPPPTNGGVPCFGKSSESEECQAEDAFCSRFLHHADILDVRILQALH